MLMMLWQRITDQVKQNTFKVLWHPGAENLADNFTKHFAAKHHIEVRPWYMHENNSPTMLPRAAEPKALRGCVGTQKNGYTKSGPLPRLDPSRVPLAKLGKAIAASTWHRALAANAYYGISMPTFLVTK